MYRIIPVQNILVDILYTGSVQPYLSSVPPPQMELSIFHEAIVNA
jgi:hypothetical protein